MLNYLISTGTNMLIEKINKGEMLRVLNVTQQEIAIYNHNKS